VDLFREKNLARQAFFGGIQNSYIEVDRCPSTFNLWSILWVCLQISSVGSPSSCR